MIIGTHEAQDEALTRLTALPFIGADGNPTRDDTGVRNPLATRISYTLTQECLRQLTSTQRFEVWSGNRRSYEFRIAIKGQENHAWDSFVYACAVRYGIANFDRGMARTGPIIVPPRRILPNGEFARDAMGRVPPAPRKPDAAPPKPAEQPPVENALTRLLRKEGLSL